MKELGNIEPTRYLRGASFNPELVETRYPNARRNMQGGLFISHAGEDYGRIQRDLVAPVIHERFAPARYLWSCPATASVTGGWLSKSTGQSNVGDR